MNADNTRRPTSTVRAYLQLVRLPAVFTAVADILLGFLLNHEAFAPVDQLALLVLASACLYSAGMAWNDIFDLKVDARERPERPIPSGRIRLRSAITLGTALLAGGVCAAMIVGPQSLTIAALLVVCILSYDGLLKSTPLGPLAMGACRSLNVMLGASAYEATIAVWSRPQTLVAAALGIYVAGITWFARTEAVASRRSQLVGSAVVVNCGLLGLAWMGMTHPWRGEPNLVVVAALLAAIALLIDVRLARAIVTPSPPRVQAAVKTMILSLPLLDASMVYAQTGRADYAAVVAALVVPGIVISRWLWIT